VEVNKKVEIDKITKVARVAIVPISKKDETELKTITNEEKKKLQDQQENQLPVCLHDHFTMKGMCTFL